MPNAHTFSVLLALALAAIPCKADGLDPFADGAPPPPKAKSENDPPKTGGDKPKPPNLLPNAGFRSPGDNNLPKDWSFNYWHGEKNIRIRTHNDGPRDNLAAVELESESPTDCGIGPATTICVKPNTKYVFGGWMRTKNIQTSDDKAKGGAILITNENYSKRQYLTAEPNTREWKQFRESFDSKDTQSVHLYGVLGGDGNASGTISFAGLFLREADAPGSPSGPPTDGHKPAAEPEEYRRPVLTNPVFNRDGLTLDKDQISELAEQLASLIVEFPFEEKVGDNAFRARALGIALQLDPGNRTAIIANGLLAAGQSLRPSGKKTDLQDAWRPLDAWVAQLHAQDATSDDRKLGRYLGDLMRHVFADKGFSNEYVKIHGEGKAPDWSPILPPIEPPPSAPVDAPVTPPPTDSADNGDKDNGDNAKPDNGAKDPPPTPPTSGDDVFASAPAKKIRLNPKVASESVTVLTAVQTGGSNSRAALRKVTLAWRDWEYKDQHTDNGVIKRKVPLSNRGDTEININDSWGSLRDRARKLKDDYLRKYRFDGWPQRGVIDVNIPHYNNSSGSCALLATALAFEAMATGIQPANNIAFIGTWNDKLEFAGHSHIAPIVLGYDRDWSELLVVGPLSSEARQNLKEVAATGLASPFLNTQLIEIRNYDEAVALATGKIPAELQRAIDAYKAVQAVRVRMKPEDMVQNRFVLDKVREVAAISPRHLSSALLLEASTHQQPLDYAASMAMLSKLYQSLEQMAQNDLEEIDTEEGVAALAFFRERLRELRPRLDRGIDRLNIKIDDALRSLEETVRIRDRTTSTAMNRIDNTRTKVQETRAALDMATAAGR